MLSFLPSWSTPIGASAATTFSPVCSRSGSFSAMLVVAQLLFLEAENPKKDISIYINSPGGTVTAGLAVYDTMQMLRPAISTLCIGQASSIAALLLMAGHKDRRFALPNARIMLHQPSGGFQGQASDIFLHAQE